ncbi:RmlC-like cupin domain-containing protein [Globomyces pollinis-pini]|nr:RmlC-like cupin domain-containing protein [Globomyces pollinis-pini]
MADNLLHLRKLLRDELGNDDLASSNIDRIKELFKSYKSDKADWINYALFDPHKYTRNLVDDGNGKYNLIVLCWGVGHQSPIHDHANSHCVVKILEGELTETLYDWPKPDQSGLVKTSQVKLDQNEVTYMHDTIGLHRVANEGKQPAISLHMYSPPIKTCQTFIEGSGEARSSGNCVFYSINGRKQDHISTPLTTIKQHMGTSVDTIQLPCARNSIDTNAIPKSDHIPVPHKSDQLFRTGSGQSLISIEK